MTKKPKITAQQAELSRKHNLAMNGLDEYSVFLDAWQSTIDDASVDGLPDYSLFVDFEDYASYAVQSFLETGEGAQPQSALSGHDCAAITVTNNGIIRQTNLLAQTKEDLVVGKTLADSGITFITQDDISTVLAKQKQDASTVFHLVQAQNTRPDSPDSFVTLAISKIESAEETDPLFLVLFITPPDTKAAIQMLAHRFNLTPIEAEIAKAFLDGISLRDIAKNRKRSYTTIRNQFQSVLDKSGCVSQTALYRVAFSLLQLIGHAASNAEQIQTHTRTMTLPRPNGRVVELVLSGDETGRPILSLPSLFGHGLTPDIASYLRERGILFISIMRPGFGGTSSPLKDQSLYDCITGDVRAILDSLEIDKCPCIARASAARSLYNLVARLPDRITHGLVVNGMIPRGYIAGETIVSKWTSALMSASIVSYPVAKLILGTGNNLLMRSKGGAFLQKMYNGSETDCATFDDAEVVLSIKSGVKEITKQGLKAGVQEIVEAFQDWSGDLRDISTPITLYHGRDDPNVPITGVEEFVRDQSHQLKLVEEPTGGGQLSYSHLGKILDLA